jgi:hypothetical protein
MLEVVTNQSLDLERLTKGEGKKRKDRGLEKRESREKEIVAQISS